MRASIVGGLLLAAGLLLGCGGPEAGVQEPAPVGTQEGAVEELCFEAYTITYFTDSSHRVRAGSTRCRCGGYEVTSGDVTPYYVSSYNGVCP
jgi:hypothetical protein